MTAGILALTLSAALPGSLLTARAGQETEEDRTESFSEVLLPAEEGLLRIGLADPVSTMDIHKTTEDYLVPLNIYERLFDIRVNEDGTTEVTNGLAEAYTVSEDGLTYHFTLRSDACFSDGSSVKASDVAFSFARMLSLPGSVQTDFADMILGAGKVMSGKEEMPEGLRVLDDTNLEITLDEPFAGYIHLLAAPSCSILSEAFTLEAGTRYGSSCQDTMGSGPYMVTEYTKECITLEKNPYYHCHDQEVLSVSKAEILTLQPALMDQTFADGGLDILDTNFINPDVVKKYVESEKWSSRLVSRSRVEIQYLMLNMEEGVLKNPRIRKAIQMAIDREEILDELYDQSGRLVDGIYPRGLIGYCEDNQGWLQYDPEEAKRIISDIPGAGEIRLELAANSENNTRKLAMLELIRQDLSDAGLNVSIVSYDADSFLHLRKAGKLMAYTGDWSADYNDPDNFIYTFFGSRQKTLQRSSNFANEEIIGRISKARTLQDVNARAQEYAELEKILVRDHAVWVPLFSTNHLFVLGERVESFSPFWAGWSSMYLKDVTLKKGQ